LNLVFLSFWFGAAKFGFATTSSLSPPACSVFRNLSFIPSRCCFDRKFRREHARGEIHRPRPIQNTLRCPYALQHFCFFFLIATSCLYGLAVVGFKFFYGFANGIVAYPLLLVAQSENANDMGSAAGSIHILRYFGRIFGTILLQTNHHPIQRIHHRRFQNRVSRDLDFVRCVWSFDFSFANGKVAEAKNKQKEHD